MGEKPRFEEEPIELPSEEEAMEERKKELRERIDELNNELKGLAENGKSVSGYSRESIQEELKRRQDELDGYEK